MAGRMLAVLLAGLLPLILYWPTTRYGFILDDFVLFKTSPSLSDLRSIPRGFVLDLGAVRKGGNAVISS